MRQEIENHLIYDIAPFWKKLRDDEYGGYYGLERRQYYGN